MFSFNLHPRPLKSGFTQDWKNFPSGRDHSAKGADHAQFSSSNSVYSRKVEEFAKYLISCCVFNSNICPSNAYIRNITFVASHNKALIGTFFASLHFGVAPPLYPNPYSGVMTSENE
jgi:hypothetical protein